jgi:hypothetical protein
MGGKMKKIASIGRSTRCDHGFHHYNCRNRMNPSVTLLLRPARPMMQKWMCLGGLIVAGLTLLLCILDIAIGIPFGGEGYFLADFGGIMAAGALGYLAYNAYQDVK